MFKPSFSVHVLEAQLTRLEETGFVTPHEQMALRTLLKSKTLVEARSAIRLYRHWTRPYSVAYFIGEQLVRNVLESFRAEEENVDVFEQAPHFRPLSVWAYRA